MEALKAFIDSLNGIIWGWPSAMPFLVVLLVGAGLFLTIRLRLIQLLQLPHAIKVIAGIFDDPKDEGDISHFQALTSALSATIGIGNIAGVATAIHYGGPGALFWMWVTAFVGMASKYAECTLSHHYRVINNDGSASGGPMYYIEKGLGSKWKWLAILFAGCAVISSFGSGNAVQSFTVADSMRADLGVPNWLTGGVLASIVAMVILGGIKRIGQVTSKLVPFMFVAYLLGGIIVLIGNITEIPAAFAMIFTQAFTPSGAIGGAAGSTILFTLTWGVKRGLFSNEAGQGSAPIAHAAAKTKESAREGAVAMIGPFIDTLLICTLTGLVIVVTGAWHARVDDSVPFSMGSGISVVKASGKGVQDNGAIDTADYFEGETAVKDGLAMDIHFVRNHSIVEHARISAGEENFNGMLRVKGGEMQLLSAEGAPPESPTLSGKMIQNGSPLTALAFRRGLGNWGGYIVTFAVLLFAISTAISWSYYGDRSIQYLFGDKSIMPYKVVFVAVYFIAALFPLEVVWGFGDAALGMMAIPNLIAIIALSGVVAKLTKDYFSRKHEPYKEKEEKA